MTDLNVAFMGKITAGMTHEIRNVLAIIRESTGLVQDLVGLSGEGLKHKDKMIRALENVQTQVIRGTEITTRLNRFAHSVDEPLAGIELNEFLQYIGLLVERFARLKKVPLEVRSGEEIKNRTTNPFLLQLILCRCVDYVLASAEEGDTMILQGVDTENGWGILVSLNPKAPPVRLDEESVLPEALMELAAPLAIIQANLYVVHVGDKPGLLLTL
jgi:signal transduction histidine kinase